MFYLFKVRASYCIRHSAAATRRGGSFPMNLLRKAAFKNLNFALNKVPKPNLPGSCYRAFLFVSLRVVSLIVYLLSIIFLMLIKSFVFALCIIVAIKGANNFEKPVGLPLFCNVIFVVLSSTAVQK